MNSRNWWKNEVKERDGYTCRGCGFDKNLHVHHILPKAKHQMLSHRIDNGLTLCGNCHSLLKGKEEKTDLRGFLPDDPKIDKQLKRLLEIICQSEDLSINKRKRLKELLEGQLSQKKPDKLAEIYCLKGDKEFAQEEYQTAIARYDNAIRLKSDFVEAYYYRGKAKYKLRQYKAAIYDYNKALSLKPDSARAYFNRGHAKFAQRQYDSTIVDYDMVLRLNPDNASAYNNRGLAKYKLGQHDAAIADFDKAIDLSRDNVNAYFNRGRVKYEQELLDAAIADFDEVNYLDPGFKKDSPYLKLAACEKSIRQNPKDALAYYYRGQANAELGQHDAAQIDYDTADWLSPRVRYNVLLREIFGHK